MRLKKFTVEGLFGLFDHEIPLNLEQRITIIHAPNAYGKTVILNLMNALFGGTSLAVYRKVEFKRITFEFDTDTVLTINQTQSDDEGIVDPRYRPRFFSILNTDKKTRKQLWEYTPWARKDQVGADPPAALTGISPQLIEEYVPFLVPDESGELTDVRYKSTISPSQALKKYWTYLPKSATGEPFDREKIFELRGALPCRLVETQRLITIQQHDRRRRRPADPPIVPVVRINSNDIVSLIERTSAQSARLAQSLDSTFPSRLLRQPIRPYPEQKLRERLGALDQRRARLTRAGLLDQSNESSLIPSQALDTATRRILTEYVTDSEKKLDTYNWLLSRIELLTEIINSRFQFKTMTVDRNEGLVFRDIKDRPVQLENLSSGEQHELVLSYDLLFKTAADALLLIDEPEISLHITWQKQFLSDLRKIIELSPMDIVLATHSPQLIGRHLDLAIQLSGPKDVTSA